MTAAINIVVTCTKRKREPTSRDLRLGNITAKTLKDKHREWYSRLRGNAGMAVVAKDLYSGDHWSVVRSLPDAAAKSGFLARVWVCSAGYGLIPLGARVHSYQATFTPGSPDSVSRGILNGAANQAAKAWWNLLARSRGPVPTAPRSIEALARRYPRCPLLIVASPGYINALEDDITSAAQIIRHPEQLMLFSGVSRKNPALTPYLVPCSARLQRVVGGARTSLNVRLLRRVLQQSRSRDLTGTSVRRSLKNLLRRQPQEVRVIRRSVTDAEARRYIARDLKVNRGTSMGSTLRRFRNDGNACEYSRFRRLFRNVQRRGSHGK